MFNAYITSLEDHDHCIASGLLNCMKIAFKEIPCWTATKERVTQSKSISADAVEEDSSPITTSAIPSSHFTFSSSHHAGSPSVLSGGMYLPWYSLS